MESNFGSNCLLPPIISTAVSVIKFKKENSYITFDSIYMYQGYWKWVKQCEILKKKLKGVNIFCFSTITVKISDFESCLSPYISGFEKFLISCIHSERFIWKGSWGKFHSVKPFWEGNLINISSYFFLLFCLKFWESKCSMSCYFRGWAILSALLLILLLFVIPCLTTCLSLSKLWTWNYSERVFPTNNFSKLTLFNRNSHQGRKETYLA